MYNVSPEKKWPGVDGQMGKIWETMETYGKTWENMGNYGYIWEKNNVFGVF